VCTGFEKFGGFLHGFLGCKSVFRASLLYSRVFQFKKRNSFYETILQNFVIMVNLLHRSYVGYCPLSEVFLIYYTEKPTMMENAQYNYDATLLSTRNKSSAIMSSDLIGHEINICNTVAV
jgi:hypothetical protein